ncbi:MAG TPA: NUDIX hydrolase [Chitinophagaceae bacterium]
MKWKILSSEYLFRDLWFTVRKDRCEAPGGRIIDPYYVYEFPTWVTAVAMTKEGEVIMVRQYRHAIGEVCIEIPGGCVDPGDPDLQSAIGRELLEETGYTFEEFHYLGKISANPSTNNNWMHMFLATGGIRTHEQQLDHNEEIDVELISLPALKKLIRENGIIQAMHLACMIYALEKMGEISL